VTSATKLYFGNLPYNCDNALLAGNIVQVRFFQHPVLSRIKLVLDC
jgi:hypothetical protein